MFIPNSFGVGNQVKQKDNETNQKYTKESFIFFQSTIFLHNMGDGDHKYNVK